MFQTPEALNPETHRSLKLSSTPDYSFAAKEIACPIVSGEMWKISQEYIMVFSQQENGLPLALMGTQAGTNAYFNPENDQWLTQYVPAHIRRYPFVAAPIKSLEDDPSGQQRFNLCVDTSAPQISQLQGQPLFNDDGTGTELLSHVQQALLSLQQDFGATLNLVKQIENADLLTLKPLIINRAEQDPIVLQGFRIIDQEKLRNLNENTLTSLIKTGALDLIYAHIGSLNNLQDGFLAKKASGQIGDGASNDMDLEVYFDGVDDTLKFNF